MFYMYILRTLSALMLSVFITYDVIIVMFTLSYGYSCHIGYVRILQGGTICLSSRYTL